MFVGISPTADSSVALQTEYFIRGKLRIQQQRELLYGMVRSTGEAGHRDSTSLFRQKAYRIVPAWKSAYE
jgi:hypothetical protein